VPVADVITWRAPDQTAAGRALLSRDGVKAAAKQTAGRTRRGGSVARGPREWCVERDTSLLRRPEAAVVRNETVGTAELVAANRPQYFASVPAGESLRHRAGESIGPGDSMEELLSTTRTKAVTVFGAVPRGKVGAFMRSRGCAGPLPASRVRRSWLMPAGRKS
jgi:hypothetical protein